MSETNTLLPTASVDFYLKDEQTSQAALQLAHDWRYARVKINVYDGDVEGAIAQYQDSTSPDLIVVETDSTDDSFTERLGHLSAYCEETTNAIVVGPVNDVDLYRNLTQMGVSDYLVRPVPLETMSEIIASTLIKELGTSGSRLITVLGAKGGVGSSALAQGLAHGLADLDHKTFLMDAAGGWSSLGVGMGFEPSSTLAEAVKAAAAQDQDIMNRMLHQVNDKLTVLATGADSMLDASVHAQQYEELIDFIMQSNPVVVVDLSDSIPSLKKAVIGRAHQITLVTTPTLSSLRATRSLIQEIKMLQGGESNQVDVLVNMAGMMPSKEVPLKDIEAALEIKPKVTIPFDAKLFMGSENEGKRLADDKSGVDIVNRLMPLTESLLGTSVPTTTSSSSADEGVMGQVNALISKIKGGNA